MKNEVKIYNYDAHHKFPKVKKRKIKYKGIVNRLPAGSVREQKLNFNNTGNL